MDIFKTFNVTRLEGKLKNGIKVVLFYRAGAPITTAAVLKSGSRYDPLSMPGCAHFLEHMVMNGSANFPSKDLLAEHIESIGGSYGATTGQESMRINTEIPDKDDYQRVIDIFNATLCNPLMDKRAFETEKNIVIKEIQRNNSNPDKIRMNAAKKIFFKDTPFEHPQVGYEEVILGLNYDDMMAEHKKLFDKSRIAFVVSGDISIDILIERLNTLSMIDGYGFQLTDDKFKIPDEPKVFAEFLDVPQTYIYFGTLAPQLFTKESLHLNILGQILANGRSSRLSKRLRSSKGLVYSIESIIGYGGMQFDAWSIATDTSDNNVQTVINEIIDEIKNIQKNGVNQSELEFIKNRRVKSLKRTMQTSNNWVDFHAGAELFAPNMYNVNTYTRDVLETTVGDIQRVIETYLGAEKWRLALCGKTKADMIRLNW